MDLLSYVLMTLTSLRNVDLCQLLWQLHVWLYCFISPTFLLPFLSPSFPPSFLPPSFLPPSLPPSSLPPPSLLFSTEDIQHWDPMTDDFKSSSFNSYTEGPGALLPPSLGKDENICLCVCNIPITITMVCGECGHTVGMLCTCIVHSSSVHVANSSWIISRGRSLQM